MSLPLFFPELFDELDKLELAELWRFFFLDFFFL
jgi:hypothetical protein